MGIATALRPLFVTHYRAEDPPGLIEDEIVHVYGGRFAGTPSPDPAEAEAWRFASLADIAAEMAAEPDAYSVWFRKYVAEFGAALARL
jgi:isopentenyl-diphosphate delta-isomerase